MDRLTDVGGSGTACEPSYSCGDRIGDKYQLVRPLESGGMGTVWIAHNLALDVHVALKFLRADHSALAAERLLREAQAAARLDHPATIRIFDFARTTSGDPFIVMELLEGESLAATLWHEFSINPVRAVQMLLPIADALAALHDAGIVHRDIKPENIFLAKTAGGRLQPKLVDFGVASLTRHVSHRLTGRGLVVGSPGYFAPEQLDLEEIDVRSDIWAFSVVLYECVTGVNPFSSESMENMFSAVLSLDPPPITEHGVGDQALAEIIARGLAKPREQRWQSMRQLGAALARWLIERGYRCDVSGASLEDCWRVEQASPISTLAPIALTRASMPSENETKVAVLPRPGLRAVQAAAVALSLAALVMIFIAGAAHYASAKATAGAQPPAAGEELEEASTEPETPQPTLPAEACAGQTARPEPRELACSGQPATEPSKPSVRARVPRASAAGIIDPWAPPYYRPHNR